MFAATLPSPDIRVLHASDPLVRSKPVDASGSNPIQSTLILNGSWPRTTSCICPLMHMFFMYIFLNAYILECVYRLMCILLNVYIPSCIYSSMDIFSNVYMT